MYTGVHSDVSWERCTPVLIQMYPGKVIPLKSLIYFRCTLGIGNKQGYMACVCIPVDSFDLRCKSVTFGF